MIDRLIYLKHTQSYSKGIISLCLCAFVAKPILAGGNDKSFNLFMQLFLETNICSHYSEERISLCLCVFVANPFFAGGKKFASQIIISHQDTKALRIK